MTLPDNLRAIHGYVNVGLFIASIYLNGSLAVLLVTERSRELIQYRHVLLIQCTIDCGLTLAGMITGMEMEAISGHIFAITNGPMQSAPPPWQYLAFSIYCMFLHTSFYITPLVFIYRYFLIVREYAMSLRQIFGFAFVVVLSGINEGAVAFVATFANDGRHAEICHRLLGNYSVWRRGGLSNCLITKDLTQDTSVLYMILCSTTMNIVAYGVMTFCTVRIFEATRKLNVNALYKSANIQRQINRIIIMQYMLPLVSSVLPLFILLHELLFFRDKPRLPGAGILGVMFFASLPLCSPLLTIMFLTRFRRRFLWNLTPLRFLSSGVRSRKPRLAGTTDPSGQRRS